MKMPAEWPPPTPQQLARRHAAHQRKTGRERMAEDVRAFALAVAWFVGAIVWLYALTFIVMMLGGGA